MKKVSKIIALLCMVALVFGVVACTAPAATPAAPAAPAAPAPEPPAPEPPAPPPEPPAETGDDRIQLTFSFWGDITELDTTQEALNDFNDMQDRIFVTAVHLGSQEIYAERLVTMAAGGNMPDTGMIDERTAIGWAREGLILPYDIYEGQPSRPKDGITFRDGGQAIAYSVASEVLALWFNRTMFDEAGIDYPPTTIDTAWTWDEFVEVAKQLTFDANGNNPGDAGFDAENIVQYGAYINQWAWQLEVWALSNGGRWYSEDGTQIVFDDAAIQGMQNVYDLHLVHQVAPFNSAQTDSGWWDSLGAGNVAMASEGQWAVGFTGDTDIDYGVAVLPYMQRPANITAGGPVGIFSQTNHPEEAAEFLRWYADPENNWGPIEYGWWMPNMMNWFTDEALLTRWIDDAPHRARLPAEAFRTAVAEVAINTNVTHPTGWYYTPNTDAVDRILIPALVEAANGTKTVAEIIEENRAALEAALAS